MDISRIILCRDMGDALGGLGTSIFGGSSSDNGAGNAIAGIGDNLAAKTAVSPQQASQTSSSFDIGQYLQQLFGQQIGQPGVSAGGTTAEQQYQQQGPLSQALYNQTLQQAQNPTAGWQSTLQPQLDQAQNQINEYYNSRGLLNSGISIGAMGTAGVDLAIQNAQNEMAYQQQSLQNANALSTNASGLGQQNVSNLAGLYNSQQGYGLQAQELANQGLEAAAGYQAYPQQAALGSYYGGVAAQQALPGQLIGAGGQLGAAMMLGCWVAAEVLSDGDMNHPKVCNARNFINNIAPKWFKNFYLKNGYSFAAYIRNRNILKIILRPLFERFSYLGGA